jgi:nucleoside 2-deoxyribosyltransferase
MKQCFVIMPIGSGDAHKVYRNRYEHIIEPAVNGFAINGAQIFQCVRADFVTQTGSITRDLIGRLYRADVVIADLTDLNPNVFYELGVRHALRSGTILIALKGTRPPFDLGDLRVIPYEDRVGGEKDAIPEIQDVLRSLLTEPLPQDSPVLHAIPELAEQGPVKEHRARLAALQRERDLLSAQLEISERVSLANQSLLESMRAALERLAGQESETERTAASTELQALSKPEQQPSSQPRPPAHLTPGDPKRAFVLMPFSADLENVFRTIQVVAAEVSLEVYRADAISTGGPIIDQIFEAIAGAGFIVADLTGRNQNVMYELGVSRAMGKDVIFLCQDMGDVPFDVRHYRVLLYQNTVAGMRRLEEMLREAFRQYTTNKHA